jgi:hypothetical protein
MVQLLYQVELELLRLVLVEQVVQVVQAEPLTVREILVELEVIVQVV